MKKFKGVVATLRNLFKYDVQGMLFAVIGLILIGTINIYSATVVGTIEDSGSVTGYMSKYFLSLLVAIAAGIAVYRFDYRKLSNRRLQLILMGLTIFSLVLVLGMGTVVNGARRWIMLGPVSVQPSEFAKLSAIIWTASLLDVRKWGRPRYKNLLYKPYDYIKERFDYMLPLLGFPFVFSAITMGQPDMGTAVLIFFFSYLLIFLAGFDGRFFGFTFLVAFLGGFVLTFFSPYRWERVQAWRDPWPYAQDLGYQTVQGLLAVGSGGLTGEGFMRGTSKYFYLPEAHTDFAFAVLAQEWGLIGGLVILFLVVMFTIYGFLIAMSARDDLGKWLATGITMLISGQALFNIAMVCGILPVTGVPLPFISYGGSALLMNSMAIGILANIGERNAQGVKRIGVKGELQSLQQETQSRFVPNRQRR